MTTGVAAIFREKVVPLQYLASKHRLQRVGLPMAAWLIAEVKVGGWLLCGVKEDVR